MSEGEKRVGGTEKVIIAMKKYQERRYRTGLYTKGQKKKALENGRTLS